MSLADVGHPVSCAAMATSVDRCTNPVISATFRHFLPNREEGEWCGLGLRLRQKAFGCRSDDPPEENQTQAGKSQVAFGLYSSYSRV